MFFDFGQGFSAENCQKKILNLTEQYLRFDNIDFKAVKAIRFDPLNSPLVVKLNWIKLEFVNELTPITAEVDQHNGLEVDAKTYLFTHSDPWFIFNV